MDDNIIDKNINLMSILESEMFKGIGKVLAERLLAHFGSNGLVAALGGEDSNAFDPVKGIGKELASKLRSRYIIFKNVVDLAVALDNRGFKKAVALKCFGVWGEKALDVIDSNPFFLLFEMDWKEVDALKRPNPMPFHPCRVIGAIEWCMYQDYEVNKNTATTRSALYRLVRKLIGCGKETFLQGLYLAQKTGVVVEHYNHLQVPAIYRYERFVEKFLAAQGDTDKTKEEIGEWLDKHGYAALNEQQREAVINALQKRFSAYYGRGGRGKTFTLKAIAHGATASDMLGKRRVILTAVANKAVKKMQSETNFPPENCRSITWLIHKQSSADLRDSQIIIDEASMMSLVDAYWLFKKIQFSNTHVVLLGDHQQIPSIHAGKLFYDIVMNNVVPNVELIKSHRHDEKTDNLLSKVLNGEFPVFEEYTKDCGTGLYRQQVIPVTERCNAIEKEIRTQQKADKMAVDLYRKVLTDDDTKNETAQIISPLRKLEYGGSSERINLLAHAKIWGEEQGYQVSTPVVWTNNTKVSSGAALSNGSTGRVHAFCAADEEFYLTVNFDFEGLVKLTYSEVSEGLDLSYCLSVHRAQGSEWDNVIIVLPKCKLIDRNMVYTALSRCRKRSVVIYHDHAFIQMKVGAPPAHVRRRSIIFQGESWRQSSN